MGRVMILNREQAPAPRFCGANAVPRAPRPSVQDLGRELEVLRGKFQTLRMAQERIEREIQKIADEIHAAQEAGNTNTARA